MRKEYDLSNARKNPYEKMLKRTVTIRLSHRVLDYFKGLSEELEIPYQTLINSYLLQCVNEKKRPSMRWRK